MEAGQVAQRGSLWTKLRRLRASGRQGLGFHTLGFHHSAQHGTEEEHSKCLINEMMPVRNRKSSETGLSEKRERMWLNITKFPGVG